MAMTLGTLTGAAAVRERRTTQEWVVEFLRDAILSGRLRGGARLVQEKIASELEVSRVPVREALLQLASEGIVRMEAHRGATVVWLSPGEVAEIFEIRTLLLSRALSIVVPRLTDEQVKRLEDVASKQVKERSMAARRKLNRAFYAVLFEALDRPRLQGMIDKLEGEVERYLQPLERPHLGHQELVEACRERDARRACEVMEQHLMAVSERAVERLRELLDTHATPQVETPRSGRRARLALASHLSVALSSTKR